MIRTREKLKLDDVKTRVWAGLAKECVGDGATTDKARAHGQAASELEETDSVAC